MASLLQKAKQLRMRLFSGGTRVSIDGVEIVFDKSSGISEQDQRDILAQINQVTVQNRIKVGPDTFKIVPTKQGYLFPAIVNFGAVVILGAGLWGLSYTFQQGESQLRGETAGLRSAEGRLIQELKREAEARLQAKDQEINSIQDRLAEIDKERADLAADLDGRVKQREAELRAAMDRELEAERARLNVQGLSEAAIQSRIRQLEQERSTAFERDLAEFRRQAEAEKTQLEGNLQRLQADFQRNLAGLTTERRQIEQESRAREDALRAQMDERARSLEAERSKTQEQLSVAEAEIRRLAELREKAAIVDHQILGFYGTVKENLSGRNYQGALTALAGLKTYLNEESIITLPGIQKRREVDLFVVDTITSMVQAEAKRTDDTATVANLLRLDSLLQEIRSAVGRAQAALGAGNVEEAERQYSLALSRIPEILGSHQYFLDKAARLERERQRLLEENLRRADAAFRAGNYRDSVEQYGRALAYLPEGVARDPILTQLQRAGFELSAADTRRDQSARASAALSEANAALARAQAGGVSVSPLDALNRYDAAIGAFVGVVQRYPQSTQAPAALEGIRKAVEERRAAAALADQATRAAVAAMERDRAAAVEAREAAERDARGATVTAAAETAALRVNVAELEKQLATMGAAASLEAAGGSSVARLPPDLAEIRREYDSFREMEDRQRAVNPNAGPVDLKRNLDAFLAGSRMRELLPGFWERIKRFDRAFEEAGRTVALDETVSITQRIAALSGTQARQRYIDEQLARYQGDEEMTRLLTQLRSIVR